MNRIQAIFGKLVTAWRKQPAGVKASLAFFFASVVSSGIGYIATPIYTHLLTTFEYGEVSLFMTWQNIFGIIAMFCLSQGVFNNGMIEYENDRAGFSFSMLVLSNMITCAFGLVIIVAYPLLSQYIQIERRFLVLMFIVFLFQPAYNFWTQRERYEYKYKKTVIASITVSILSPVFAVIGMHTLSNDKVAGRLFGAEGALILFYIIFYFVLVKKSGCRLKKEYLLFALKFNLPLIPHYLSVYLLSYCDRVMISKIIGNSATAFYSLAYTVASVVLIVWSAANASLIPYTYEKCKEKDYKAISKATLPILAAFGTICFVLILVAPELIQIMATAEYKEAIYAIPPIVGGVFFQVHYSMYANVLYYYKKPTYVMLGSFVATVANIGLNYVFIPRMGYIAAGYTTLACYIVQASIDYFLLKKTVGSGVYNMRLVGGLSIAIVIIAMFSQYLYSYFAIRYLIVLMIGITAFVFRKKIISFMLLNKQGK